MNGFCGAVIVQSDFIGARVGTPAGNTELPCRIMGIFCAGPPIKELSRLPMALMTEAVLEASLSAPFSNITLVNGVYIIRHLVFEGSLPRIWPFAYMLKR